MLDTATHSSAPIVSVAPPAMPTMDDFLSDYARKNPDLAWMTQMIAAQRQLAVTVHDTPAIDTRQAEVDALQDELAESQARADKLQRIARRLSDELEATQELVADLAAAFGACGLCCGTDPHCRSCRGRGKPGRFAPDPELRARFFTEPVDRPDASRVSTPHDQDERR